MLGTCIIKSSGKKYHAKSHDQGHNIADHQKRNAFLFSGKEDACQHQHKFNDYTGKYAHQPCMLYALSPHGVDHQKHCRHRHQIDVKHAVV